MINGFVDPWHHLALLNGKFLIKLGLKAEYSSDAYEVETQQESI